MSCLPKKPNKLSVFFKIFLGAFILWAVFMAIYTLLIHDTVRGSLGSMRQVGSPSSYWKDPITNRCYVLKWGQIVSTECGSIPSNVSVRDW